MYNYSKNIESLTKHVYNSYADNYKVLRNKKISINGETYVHELEDAIQYQSAQLNI